MSSHKDNNGRKVIWVPNDLHEMVVNYAKEYNLLQGTELSVPQALVKILDEWDVLKDAALQESR